MLAFPQHQPQLFHHQMLHLVQVARLQQIFYRAADAWGLVYAALLRNRQMHRQVQKGVDAVLIDPRHSRLFIGKIAGVFGVFAQPFQRQSFNGLQAFAQGTAVGGFGKNLAKKTPHLRLIRGKHYSKPCNCSCQLSKLYTNSSA